jgi:hypothetical protein
MADTKILDVYIPCQTCGKLIPAGGDNRCLTCRLIDLAIEPKLKWIPVTERLPDVASTHKTPWDNYSESIRVLCACLQADGKRMVKEGYCKVYEGYEANPNWKIPGTIHSVTHWMYLPEPPKGE